MMKNILIITIIFSSISCYSQAQQLAYGVCNDCWQRDSLGNHRVVMQFSGSGNVAHAIIPWRRNDDNPQEKRIILQDAKTKKKILNVDILSLNREKAEVYFQPVSGKGEYYLYYLPYVNEGSSNYPKGIYQKPEHTASAEWLNSLVKTTPVNVNVLRMEAVDSFDTFFPMEVIATKSETESLKTKHAGKSFIVFPEDRLHPIRMKNDLPLRWIRKGSQNFFNGDACKGEHYSFQLGVYALKNLQDVKVQFTGLKSSGGREISSKNISCINTNGIAYDGKPFVSVVNVNENSTQPLWCTVDVPKDIPAGIYKGKAVVSAQNEDGAIINITVRVNNKVLEDGGVGEPWKQTRLQWLNSTLAQNNEVIKPYIPLQTSGDTMVSLLGRKIIINNDGFPKQIQTFFTKEMTGYKDSPENLLTGPIHFYFTKRSDEKNIDLKPSGITFTERSPGTVKWNSLLTSDALEVNVGASLEFDGFLAYTVKVTALKDIDFSDIEMHIPFKKETASYMMGLGHKGGYRPPQFEWKWDVAQKNQDGAWIGNVNAGLQFSLRDEKYVRPLNTNFYLQKPLLLPASWGNENKGGITIENKNASTLVNAYSGFRTMKKGDVLYYNFNLLITPFHPINTDFQWETRFYHRYNSIDSIKQTGATVINIHHATPVNPWINYPFIEWKKLKNYVDEAHRSGLKVKIYNTVRELSNHAYETFALRSLGHEVYSPGKGGGYSWLQEHIGKDYIAAWFVPEIRDAAIINSGMNRWHNYYVEGMNWLTQNVGIDGIYLDDVAFDRITMKRIKRVLVKDGHPGIIDLHSANQFNKSDGFNNSANLYMEHFPYLNRLWFGEYFDYEKGTPDFYLTEVSGIPFGLMGEMLQDGGNPWRGMIYGMTNRLPWSADSDPRPIWKLWDDFGMKGTEMIGYWSDNCPVTTNNENVKATVYKKNKKALIAIASWANEDVKVQLSINWSKLGIDKNKASIYAKEISTFQPSETFGINEEIPVKKGKGWLLIVEEK